MKSTVLFVTLVCFYFGLSFDICAQARNKQAPRVSGKQQKPRTEVSKPQAPSVEAGKQQASSASGDIDLTGIWLADSSYMREYMLKGREMQLKWCGFGWPESEIERRLQMTKDFYLKYEFSKVANGTFNLKIFNNEGYVKTEKLSCSIGSEKRIECMPESGNNRYFRLEKEYLYAELLMHKSMMNCPNSKEPPDETQWVEPFRMTKQK